MCKGIKELEKFAEANNVKIKGLDNMPELFMEQIEFTFRDEVYAAEGFNITLAEHKNGRVVPLTKVSDEYVLVQHHEALHQALDSILTQAPEFGAPEINCLFDLKGGRMWSKMTFPEVIEIVPNDPVKPQVILVNSADLSKRFQIEFGAFQLVCSNGLVVPDERFPNRTLIKNLHKKGSLDINDALEKMMVGFEGFSDTIGLWKRYAELPVGKPEILAILENSGFSEKQSEKILLQDLRGFETPLEAKLIGGNKANAWMAYSAATQYITDNNVNEGTAIDRGRKVSEGFESLLLAA